jgi:type I restriction enzyme M protein
VKQPSTANYGTLIKLGRQRLGVTQEKLARSLKVSFPTVNRWENGKTQPDERARHALATLLRAKGPELRELADQIDGGEEPSPVQDRPKRRRKTRSSDTALPTEATTLDTKSMEGMLWKAACSIRGEKDAPKFKDYILPLLFLKRLSDVFEDEVARLAETYGDTETALTILDEDHSLVRFYIPELATWPVLAGRKQVEWPAGKAPKTLGERLTNAVRAVARANPSLQGVVDIVDFNETRNGEREVSDEALHRIIELFSEPRYRLGLKDVEADFLGRAYEYLLRKFAEGQGQSAGEFFTPKEVGWLIAHLVEPKQGEEVYDYACGSAGLLIKCELRLLQREKKVKRPLKLHGQELTGSSFAIARMNMVLHDMEGEIVRGNTMTNPKFLEGSRLKRFDIVVANPMWNQDNIDPAIYESDPYERFASGYAPASGADWAWLQHTVASLSDSGRAAVVLDTGAVSRGSGSQGDNKEKTIRKAFVENDWIEGVILLPDNLFYNTTATGIIVMLNRSKPKERRGKVVLINASGEFEKGRPKNYLPETAVSKLAAAFHAGVDGDRLVKVVTAGEIAANDYNLSPSRYVETGTAVEEQEIQPLLDELTRIEREARDLDGLLLESFGRLGFSTQRELPARRISDGSDPESRR